MVCLTATSISCSLITFKAIHGLAPVYISELISVRDVSLSRYCLRSTNSLTLNYPALKSGKTLGDRSFFVAAPKLWNELPSDIRDLNSINKFKTAIKTYLIYIYIYVCIYIYIWEKKTNKLQVHPYKPVSWSPTHQGILQCKMMFNWGVGYLFGGLRNSSVLNIHPPKI